MIDTKVAVIGAFVVGIAVLYAVKKYCAGGRCKSTKNL